MGRDLKKQYDALCEKYIKAFCKKQGFDFEYYNIDNWGTVEICDHYFFMGDIRHDVDNNIQKDLIIEWYDENLERYQNENSFNINYRAYCGGVRYETLEAKEHTHLI